MARPPCGHGRMADPCRAEAVADRGTGVLGRRGSAARTASAEAGGTRASREGPAVGAGPENRRRPGARPPGGEVCRAWSRRGCPLGGRKRESDDFCSFCQARRPWRGGCQSQVALWGRRGPAWRRRVGRRPPSCLENKELGAGSAGAASAAPPSRATRGLAGRLSEALPELAPGWEECSALLFPGREKRGGGSCCHVVAQVFRLRVLAPYTRPPLARLSTSSPRGGGERVDRGKLLKSFRRDLMQSLASSSRQ